MLSELLKENYLEIPTELFSYLEEYSKENDIKKLSMNIFGFSSKRSLSIIRNLINDNNLSYSTLNLIKILAKDKKYNQNLIFNIFENDSLQLKNFSLRNINKTNISLLEKIFNEKQILNIVSNKPDLLSDLFSMLKKVLKHNGDINNLKKYKDTISLHDQLSFLCSEIDSDFDLEQRPDILMLDNKSICQNLKIIVPKTHFDLVNLGEMLNFCIGNGDYSYDVKQKRCSIVSIYNENKPLYGVQFTRYSVLQARGFSNSRIPDDILLELQNLLTERPQIPNDFIAITDSKFITGYKYNNKDLYLSMNEKIYIYFDVPNEIYEELIESDRKGSYLNSHIKNKYSYERLN